MDVSAKIITQFVKDLSFENPMGPGAFQQGSERPAINANVDVKATNRKDTDIYEVELNINISAKRCLLYTSPSPRDQRGSRMPSSA